MLKKIVTVPMALWASMVFLGSLPYKFSNHPDTQHIFGTIGDWIGWAIGSGFSAYAAYVIGSLELVASVMILSGIILWAIQAAGFLKNKNGNMLIALGGALWAALMGGAMFFHIVSPLWIVVLHNGVSDGWALFKSAASVFVIGVSFFFMYKSSLKNTFIAKLPVLSKII